MAKRQFDYGVAVELYQRRGASCASVAAKLGVGEGAIRKALTKLGIPRHSKGRRRFDYRMIIRDYLSGLTPAAIAETRGCAVSTIGPILRKAGVTLHRRLCRVRVPTDPATIGYLAGLIDGEGTIYSRRSKAGFSEHRITIVNTDSHLIDWLAREIGGSVSWRSHTRLGRKPVAAWTISRKVDAHVLLLAVAPYLKVKAHEAGIALTHLQNELH